MISLTNFPKTRFEMLNLLFQRTFLTDWMKRWREQVEILKSVIRLISISVMHMLIRGQAAAKVLFHYQTVFRYITSFISGRILSAYQNIDVAITSSQATTFPSGILFSGMATSWCPTFIMSCLNTVTPHGIYNCRGTTSQLCSDLMNAFPKSFILMAKPSLITKLGVSFPAVIHTLYYTVIAIIHQQFTVRTVRGYSYA